MDGLVGSGPLSPGGKSPAGRSRSLMESFGTSQISSSSTAPSSTTSTAVSLSRVIHEEAEAKERWKRETKKSLQLIQIEEQALKELKSHYEMIYGRDGEELIQVERAVEAYVWQPMWRKSGATE